MKERIYFLSLLVLLLTTHLQVSDAFVYPFDGTSSQLFGWRSAQYKIGAYNQSPGNGLSYALIEGLADMNISSNNVLVDSPAELDIVFFHSDDSSYLGFSSGDFCCDSELYQQGKCSRPANVILPSTAVYTTTKLDGMSTPATLGTFNSISYYNIHYTDYSTPQSILLPYNVGKEGVYYAYLLSCNSRVNLNATTVHFSGKITFMNPYGYLNGERHPFLAVTINQFIILKFYLVLAVAYLLLSFGWAFLSFKHRHTLLPLQYWISLVLLLGFIETMVQYGSNSSANKNGTFSNASLAFISIFVTLKGGISRLIVLLCSMGYGILIPTIPQLTKYKIATLTILYCIFKSIQYYLWLIPTASTSEQVTMVFFNLAVSILDVVFYWWIFSSFMKIFSRLSLKKQKAKLEMYQKFFVALVISAVLTLLIIFISIMVNHYKSADQTWKFNWLSVSVWDVLYFGLLCVLAWIWKPNDNNQRYKYNEVVDNDEDSADVVLHPLGFGTSGLSQRSNVNNDEENGTAIPGTEDGLDSSNQVETIDEHEQMERFKKDSFNMFD
ncbi:seven transmembrane domain protein [Cavenderia fasciculata]|uniref:Seven transmembrane domain protein n=1 Tax=Cavenderia fasciculata TaxID=261658 RepID=F4PV44_CACFS|nr:seven transmembrane domain protein [Cavenderia fasciculata]EGG21160.1 seven transmembrane domain protein [Cavenderia fasciculata]|eukprot:XP_004359010.1 seven transmembrane domain protein [Cavenderia fasciculata]